MSKAIRVTAVFVAAVLAASAAHAQWTWTPQTKRWINVKRLPKETPELQIEYARSLLLEGNYRKALRETNKFTDYYGLGEFADQNQFLRGEIQLAQGDYVAASKEFQRVVTEYPDTPLYEQVIAKQYEIGDALYERGEKLEGSRWRPFHKRPYKRAIQVYSMVIDNQPFTDAAAEAQYKVGLCHYKRKEYVEAAFEYRRVIEDYSTSDWVDDGCYGLAICYYDGSHPADYDQTPSLRAIEAIDDFKQRFASDERGAELDPKRAELRERVALQRLKTAQFYEKRRDFAGARIYFKVLVDDFGDTSAGQTAQQWLTDNPVTEVTAVDRVLHEDSAS